MTGLAASVNVESMTTEPMHLIVDALEILDIAAREVTDTRARELINTGAEHLAYALTALDDGPPDG